jgi:hypothetical protein
MHDNDNYQDDARPIPVGSREKMLYEYGSIGKGFKWRLLSLSLVLCLTFVTSLSLGLRTDINLFARCLISLTVGLFVGAFLSYLIEHIVRKRKRAKILSPYVDK